MSRLLSIFGHDWGLNLLVKKIFESNYRRVLGYFQSPFFHDSCSMMGSNLPLLVRKTSNSATITSTAARTLWRRFGRLDARSLWSYAETGCHNIYQKWQFVIHHSGRPIEGTSVERGLSEKHNRRWKSAINRIASENFPNVLRQVFPLHKNIKIVTCKFLKIVLRMYATIRIQAYTFLDDSLNHGKKNNYLSLAIRHSHIYCLQKGANATTALSSVPYEVRLY